jgi:hypothetical protein
MLDSAIRGTAVKPVLPVTPGSPSPVDAVDRDFDVLFTAETHNFPCAVSLNSCLSILDEQFAIWLKNEDGLTMPKMSDGCLFNFYVPLCVI